VGAQAKELLDLLGIQGVPEVLYSGDITGLPALNITGITGYGQFSHGNSYQRLWDFFDNVTFLRKRHSLKFGVNTRKDVNYNLFWPKPGSFAFTGVFTGFGLADFLLGLPLSSVRDYPRAALGPDQRVGWYTGWYVQDDFKLSPRLTLNFGLRWDVNLPAHEIHDLYSGFDPKTGNLLVPSQEALDKVVPTFPQTITLVTAAQAGFPERLRHTDWNNFAPRIGIAWRPFDEKTVIRTGYGIYNDNLSLGYLNTGSPWGGNETFMNRVENGVPLWQLPAAFPAGAVGERPGTISINALDPNIKNPYVQQWNLTLERQIEAMVVRLQYIGTKSTHLYWYPNLNLPEPSTIPFSDSRRPYPQYRDITYRTNGGDSIYHAMTLGAERRLRHGITFNSYWTWAKALTDSYDAGGERTDLTGAGLLGFWFPTFDRRRWRGNEQYVPRHRWTTTWFAELPFGREKHFGSQWNPVIDFVAGGWALSGIFDALTGWYVSPYYTGGTDPASIGVNSGPPDRIASGLRPISELKPGGQFLDPTAFVIPSSNIGRFGNAGINFVQSPGSWSFDVGLQKTFPIRERLRFEFLCKILNVLNHAGFDYQYALYGGLDLSNPATFGTQVRSPGGNRQIGFIGRLTW
jgi:hypothetical protein